MRINGRSALSCNHNAMAFSMLWVVRLFLTKYGHDCDYMEIDRHHIF